MTDISTALRYKISNPSNAAQELFHPLLSLSTVFGCVMAAESNVIRNYAEIMGSTKTCFVAAFCLSIYDICKHIFIFKPSHLPIIRTAVQTFPEEIEYYWTGRWNIPRAFYFLARYLAFIIEILEMLSLAITLMMSILDCIFLIIVQAILIIRIHAVYADRRLPWGLALLLSMGGTCIFVLSILANSASPMRDELIPGVRFCAYISPKLLGKLIWANWVPILIFDTVLAFLAALVAYRNRGLHQEHSTLLNTLLRDSLAYFLTILGVAIITIIMERVALIDSPGFVALKYPILSACAVRLLLHLRIKDKQLREGRYTGELGPENYMSSMHFGAGHEPLELVMESSEG
ncbi:hypothetical protein SISNIDRAFT_489991 [Sistotremastrum niveocremeum HHB9708]|uniref:DUF6533 domain-containing protein n=1 Tax=Sistotremastrum niveocremeum HHB9708 TaxID=1314777 RepID=A0A164PBK6_9AGAM|nr:hypothetical protein SISNIDRAFT_489991 [Sistotremastrum niveocremeum HHB9708]